MNVIFKLETSNMSNRPENFKKLRQVVIHVTFDQRFLLGAHGRLQSFGIGSKGVRPLLVCRLFAPLSRYPVAYRHMGKAQKKTGKGRLDKYYKLAKCVLQTPNRLPI